MVLLSYACFHFIHPSLFTFVINTMQVIIVYACMYIYMYEHGAFRFSIIESQLCFCLFMQDIYIYGQTHYFEIFCQVERNLEREAICEEAIKWRWESVS